MDYPYDQDIKGVPFKIFPVKGVDVSTWNDYPDTVYQPDLSKTRFFAQFCGVRIGYGLVKDRMLDYFWKAVPKAGIDLFGYWYLDYYSHKGKISGVDWGVEQAYQCWEMTNQDPRPVFLDIEPSQYGGNFTPLSFPGVATIARAWLTEWMRLSGDRKRIYSSPGFLPYYGDWFKDAELWLPWYSRTKTYADIQVLLKARKWRGPCVIMQYASDGDINGDGVGDGRALGMESTTLDLNVFLGSMAEYSKWIGNANVITPELPAEDEPAPVTPPVISRKREVGVMKVNSRDGLNIRKTPAVADNWIGWIAPETDVDILEVVQRGDDFWARVGRDQFCAIRYKGTHLLV